MIYVFIFFTSLTLTIFSLPYVINILKKLGLVDKPGGRKMHTEPIPIMGGIVIYVVTFIILFSFLPDLNMIRLINISTTLLLICGMIDDRNGLGWKRKFVIQFAAATSAVIFLIPKFETVRFFAFIIPAPWSYLLLIVFIVGAVNSINLMDGIDGLVTGFSLIVFFMIFWLAYLANNYFLLIMCSALIGSTLGFLKFNAFPARIFLGDTGSLVLGMFIVFAALLITPDFSSDRSLSLTFPVILLGLPLIDTLKVMSIRLWRKRSPFMPDRNHLHHVLMENNINHKYVVFILQLVSIFFVLLAYYYMVVSKIVPLILFVLLGGGLLLMQPFVSWLSRINIFKINIAKIANKVPGTYLTIYKKFLIPLSIFTAALLVTFLLPGHSGLPVSTKLILIGACASLFFISHYQFIKHGVFSETYVLINLLIFTSVASISSPLINPFSISSEASLLIIRFSNFFLFFFIVFFLLTREKLFALRPTFLSGMDLIILVLIFLMTVVQNFVQKAGLDFIGINLIIGFGIYLWYKIILNWKTSFGIYLFYFSFFLPIASLLILIIG